MAKVVTMDKKEHKLLNKAKAVAAKAGSVIKPAASVVGLTIVSTLTYIGTWWAVGKIFGSGAAEEVAEKVTEAVPTEEVVESATEAVSEAIGEAIDA